MVNVSNSKALYFRIFLIAATAGIFATTATVGQAPDIRNPAPNDTSARLPPRPYEVADKTKSRAVNQPKAKSDTIKHLSLDSAVDLLTRNNLSVIAARFNVNMAEAQKLVAGLRPQASLTVNLTNFTIPRVFQHPYEIYTTNGNAAANVTYGIEYDRLLERGDKRNLRISQAELNRQASETQVLDILRQQISQLKQTFLSAVLARENLRVALDNYRSFNGSQIILASQVAEGYAAGVDLKRIELQKLSFQHDISNSEQTFQQSIRDIYNLIGAGDSVSVIDDLKTINYDNATFMPQMTESLDILDGTLNIQPTLLSVAELRRLAIENRPDIKTAGLNLEAARAGFKLAVAQNSRDITVGVQYLHQGNENTVGATATIPLGLKQRAELAEAQAQVNIKIAETGLRQAETQAMTDVEKAFTAYMISRERLRLFTDQSLTTAQDVRRIEEISYRDGAKGLLDYLDAQHIYNQTVTDYNQSRYDYLLSLTQLESAVGTKLPVK